jgi:hypothetical protein
MDIQKFDGIETSINVYQGASTLLITEDEAKKLDEPLPKDLIEIRPDGLIYPPQVFWREKLNSVFGRGQWALIKHQSIKDPDRDKVYYDGSLLVRNCFIARATGEAEYHLSNPMQSWASVEESAKSDCLGRCCKDLSIFKELWQPQYVREWIKDFGVKVFISFEKNGKKETKPSWRHLDSQPYWNESGVCPDSPNQPKFKSSNKNEKRVKDYLVDVNKCNSQDELNNFWSKLTPDEKNKNKKYFTERKDVIVKECEAKTKENANKAEELSKRNFEAEKNINEQLKVENPESTHENVTSSNQANNEKDDNVLNLIAAIKRTTKHESLSKLDSMIDSVESVFLRKAYLIAFKNRIDAVESTYKIIERSYE